MISAEEQRVYLKDSSFLFWGEEYWDSHWQLNLWWVKNKKGEFRKIGEREGIPVLQGLQEFFDEEHKAWKESLPFLTLGEVRRLESFASAFDVEKFSRVWEVKPGYFAYQESGDDYLLLGKGVGDYLSLFGRVRISEILTLLR